jgi:amino acid adenylation domain-containing protein
LPFEKLVEGLQPERSLNHNPLFHVAFVLQNVPTLNGAMFDQQPAQTPMTVGAAKFDLSLALAETEHEITGSFEYLTALFNGDTISRMIGHFKTLLASIVAYPEARLSELALMSEGERQQLLAGAHGKTMPGTSEISVHELFEKHAQQSPEHIAAVFGDTKLTYAQLNRRANAFARHLQSLGVGPETKVGLFVESSPQLLIGLLGILKAGGAFVPLDPAHPPERIAYMLRDAGVQVVATQTDLADKLNIGAAQLIYLDQLAEGSDENPRSGVMRNSLAYVIYTSGSTGAPKGVLIEHGGLSNMARAQTRLFCMLPEDRVLLFGSLSFDASIFEVVMTLTNGATLYLASREDLLPGALLNRRLNDWAITTITLPPSALAAMPVEELPALRKIIAAAEACPAELVSRWSRHRRFFNAYGPTETSIWSTLCECDDASAPPPIGCPIDNTSVYVLDSFLAPVPLGGRGEIYIGGTGVGRAYLNLPELTAERFIPDPFSQHPGARLYRTGDLGRQRRDGQIEFLGRVDHQVKLRGFRIELGEIELALQEHPDVLKVAVVLVEAGAVGKRLVAYVESSNTEETLAGQLRSFVKTKLPEYMIPSSFVIMDQLPLTASSKIDRRALPAPEAARGPDQKLVAPEGAVEEVLAEIWAELLGLDQIGRHESFFELGGHSLLATQVVSRVLDVLSVELQVRQIFQTQTIAELARAILDNSAQPERVERTANLVLRLSQLTDAEAVSLLEERTVA